MQNSPSPSARSPHRYKNPPKFLPSQWDELFCGSTHSWSYVTLSSGMSAVISCASVHDRIHSSSSNNFVAGSLLLLQEMSCVLWRNRHSSGRSPIAHLICESVESSKLTPSLPCAREGDDCTQLFLSLTCRASLTCGSDAIPVLLRPCSLVAPCLALPCTCSLLMQHAPRERTPYWWDEYRS